MRLRFTTSRAQHFRLEKRVVRVSMTCAASKSAVRTMASPTLLTPPSRSVSPDWYFFGVSRDHHARRRAGGFQEPLHEPLRSARVSSALDQDVENEAILVDSAPEPMLFARDRDNDLVQMPFVAASGSALAENALPNFRPHWRTVS
ncbi:hypothetical protein ACVIW2_009407 [Bradyrhizobium huanghuaihaiense]